MERRRGSPRSAYGYGMTTKPSSTSPSGCSSRESVISDASATTMHWPAGRGADGVRVKAALLPGGAGEIVKAWGVLLQPNTNADGVTLTAWLKVNLTVADEGTRSPGNGLVKVTLGRMTVPNENATLAASGVPRASVTCEASTVAVQSVSDGKGTFGVTVYVVAVVAGKVTLTGVPTGHYNRSAGTANRTFLLKVTAIVGLSATAVAPFDGVVETTSGAESVVNETTWVRAPNSWSPELTAVTCDAVTSKRQEAPAGRRANGVSVKVVVPPGKRGLGSTDSEFNPQVTRSAVEVRLTGVLKTISSCTFVPTSAPF